MKETASSRAVTLLRSAGRSRWIYLPLSLLLLLPCYWQERVQAGDLSSHIYNAWLARSIDQGQLPGLEIVPRWTNVVFDLLLLQLWRLGSADAAQRIAVALAVLVFIWGAFAFAAAVAGRRPWHVLPFIAMLAYGWVYHMGFFNFYLSMGLCFWALALLWKWSLPRAAGAAAILMVAFLAHALPVLWMGGLLVYRLLARRLPVKGRMVVIFASMASMVVLHFAIASRMHTLWSLGQIIFVSGLNQVDVFDTKYYAIEAALLVLWALPLVSLIRSEGVGQSISQSMESMPLQFAIVTAAGVFLLPTEVLLPAYQNVLAFIADRMSLGVAICLMAALAPVRPKRFECYAAILVALVFFGFLYADERSLNDFEDHMQQAVANLPPGQRVVSAFTDPDLNVNALAHMIDRVCIGHCYSYANYEPSSGQFRVQATGENRYVAYPSSRARALEIGVDIVRETDLPLYLMDFAANGTIAVKSVAAGTPLAATSWSVLENTVPEK